MKITDRVGNVINDLELIVRTNIGENNKDSSRLFRNTDTSEKAIRSEQITSISVPIYIGDALIEILEYLENRYNISIDKLEQVYLEKAQTKDN